MTGFALGAFLESVFSPKGWQKNSHQWSVWGVWGFRVSGLGKNRIPYLYMYIFLLIPKILFRSLGPENMG